MFKDVSNKLRQAYDACAEGDKTHALMLIYEALEIARTTDNRVLRAHIVQCSERVKGAMS